MVLNPTWSLLRSLQLLPVMLPLDCYLMCPFCMFHPALGLRKRRPEEKKTETGCKMGAEVEQGPRTAPGKWNYPNACGKFFSCS